MEEVFEFVYKNIPKTQADSYAYMTMHRAENTDDSIILEKRIKQVGEIDSDVIWPIHPRTKKQLIMQTFNYFPTFSKTVFCIFERLNSRK